MPTSRQPGFDLFARSEGPRVLTVTELTQQVKGLIEGKFPRLWVAGEVSGCRRQASGHVYFTLKDAGACLSAVLFKGQAQRLRFKLQDGAEVLAAGRLTLYAPRGQYQLVIDHLEPRGQGALQAAFEEMKARLSREGLFDSARKRPLPTLPKAIGVVTSPTGAAVHDFLRVLLRRNPHVSVLIAPAKVQGAGAAADVARQLARLDARGDLDLLVVTRGGGSIEDLWAFNEEVLARAIAACRTPVVSAVGHEVDLTIADLVADLRAPTPSAAAEMIVPDHRELVRGLRLLRDRLAGAAQRRLEQRRATLAAAWGRAVDPRRVITDRRLDLEEARARLEGALTTGLRARSRSLFAMKELLDRQHPRARLQRLGRGISDLEGRLGRAMAGGLRRERGEVRTFYDRVHLHHPRRRIEADRRRLGQTGMRLSAAVMRDLAKGRQRHAGMAGKLDALSPLRVLDRGYSVVRAQSGAVVRFAEDVEVGEILEVRTARACIRAGVIQAEPAAESDHRACQKPKTPR